MAQQIKLMHHGVFMNIFGLGVIFTGESGVGKSELALTLLDRGHSLVADDMIELYKNNFLELYGGCPPALQNLLEIRGVGIFDVSKLFGVLAISNSLKVSLIIHLSKTTDVKRNIESWAENPITLLDTIIPQVTLEYRDSRPFALLAEIIVRQRLLLLAGGSAMTLPTMNERIPL